MRMETIRGECDKDKVMMEASIKRLELESKSWQSKFLDKVSGQWLHRFTSMWFSESLIYI